MRTPKISVITPSFNQGEFIEQNIKSVLAQNYPEVEHIVIDGGSTDMTVEILQRYPHLNWSSEPDNGQTDALNKGFSKATGEIIAWINSDDWYPPGVFHEIAKKLEEYPIVMGACEQTDRDGNTTEIQGNLERTWYDLLKYWVYYSIPAQPSIFFKREVLERVKRDDGTYLDNDLEFGMDYEFWLRLAKEYDFTRRIDKTLSYSRMYDTNKTGQNMAAAYAEYSRVFSRHEALSSTAERRISFVIPIDDKTDNIDETLTSIFAQSLSDFEVLLVDYSSSDEHARLLKNRVVKFGADYPQVGLRVTRAEGQTYLHALNTGIKRACAPLLACIKPGAKIDEDFCHAASNYFMNDVIAFGFPSRHKSDRLEGIYNNVQGRSSFDLHSIFQGSRLPESFVARKVALLELGGIRNPSYDVFGVRELLLRLLFKGWQIGPENNLGVCDPTTGDLHEKETLEVLKSYINAQMIINLRGELEQDPQGGIRASHGFSVVFPEELVNRSRELLARGPGDWYTLGFVNNVEKLKALTAQFPNFSPGWYFLSENLKQSGDSEHAKKMYESYSAVRAGEAVF